MIVKKNNQFEIKQQKQILVSIIIPVHNSEKYLRQCLNSCINQTYKNIEIICIDDCSTDKSYQILLEYQIKDNRIKIFRNSSLKLAGYCRNFGLDNSSGDYIYFADSDDYIELNLIYTCINELEKKQFDICIFDYTIYDNKMSNNLYIKQCKNELNSIQNRFECLYPNPWSKIFKKQFITQNNIKFAEGFHNTNDLYFIMTAAIKTNKICYINKSLYNYRVSTEYSSQKLKDAYPKDSIINILNFFNDIKKMFNNTNIYSLYLFIYKQILWNFNTLTIKKSKDSFIYILKQSKLIKKFPLNIYFNNKLKKLFSKLYTICYKKNYEFPDFSIIIPVHNSEKYLRQCLNSCINQTYKNIEIICIDDCSTDKSYQILLEYQIKDNRIKIFRSEKHSNYPGKIRNIGLNYCLGEYILCVDSDDYLHKKALEILASNISKHPKTDYILYTAEPVLYQANNDLLLDKFNMFKMYYSKYSNITLLNGLTGLELMLKYDNKLIYSNCLHCIKSDIIYKNNLKYIDNIIFEDELFTRQTLQFAKYVLILNNKLYYRTVHENSIMTNTDILNKINSLIIYNNILKTNNDELINDKLKIQLKQHLQYKLKNLIFT